MPALCDAGFEQVDARNAWRWLSDCIWVFNIRAVGNYFARVTGWPPASVGVWLGVYYNFVTPLGKIKVDGNGRLRPAEYKCHRRSHLVRGISQLVCVRTLDNPADQKRRDIWWLAPDGANAKEVAVDIARRIAATAIPWFKKFTDLELALANVETERNCFNKYVLAAYLAGKLDKHDVRDKYRMLAESEGKRIGRVPDPKNWFEFASP